MSKIIQDEKTMQASTRRRREEVMAGRQLSIDPATAAATAGRRLFAALLALSCVGGCHRDAGEDRQSPPPAVDVAPALEIDTAADPTAAERAPELVGVLPADFPDDLPLYLPASLVDWGSGESGPWVELLTPHRRTRVEPELTALIRDGGWTVSGADGTHLLRKGNRRVRLRIEDGKPGTLYRFEY